MKLKYCWLFVLTLPSVLVTLQELPNSATFLVISPLGFLKSSAKWKWAHEWKKLALIHRLLTWRKKMSNGKRNNTEVIMWPRTVGSSLYINEKRIYGERLKKIWIYTVHSQSVPITIHLFDRVKMILLQWTDSSIGHIRV